jgi:hypothetical protein
MADKAPPMPSWQGSRDPKGGISTSLWSWLQSLGNFTNAQAQSLAQISEASASDYRSDQIGFKALTPETVWDAAGFVNLTDAASIPVDMSAGFNFQVTIAGNRTLANPSNAKPGQAGVIRVAASGAQTINKGSNYASSDAVSWPISIPSGSGVYIYYHVWAPSTIIITGVIGPNFN